MTSSELKQKISEVAAANFEQNIFGKCRKLEYLSQRQAAMYAVKKLTRFSLTEIGRICSSGHEWDHATVLNSVKRIDSELYLYWRRKDVEFWIKQIKLILNNGVNDKSEFQKKAANLFNKFEMILLGEELETLKQIKSKVL